MVENRKGLFSGSFQKILGRRQKRELFPGEFFVGGELIKKAEKEGNEI